MLRHRGARPVGDRHQPLPPALATQDQEGFVRLHRIARQRDQFRRAQPPYTPPELPNYAFEEQTLFESHRGPLRLIRKLLQPILKLFFNPNPLIQALNIQSRLNTMYAEREARNEAARRSSPGPRR